MSDPQQSATSGDFSDVKNGPLAKAGPMLIGLFLDYQEFVRTGATGRFSSARAAGLLVQDANVKLDVRGPALDRLVPALRDLGMQVEADDPRTGTVAGWLPIAQLPVVAQHPEVASVGPVFRPIHR